MALPEERYSQEIAPSFRASGSGTGAGTVILVAAADVATGLCVVGLTLAVSLSAAGTVTLEDTAGTDILVLHFAGADTVVISDPTHGFFEAPDGLGVQVTNSAGNVSAALSFSIVETDQ